ncbi:MAG: MFS transporter [Anaerolineales bacterium]|nr:MFS transporter [Anaerolineales bacterium]
MTTATRHAYDGISEGEYRHRIRAWTMYDWANSAFATTILAAVLPIYYSQVAGSTLPSAATATAYWSTGLSVSLLITAIMAPILGTISDVRRGKKGFLSFFVSIGVIATALLVLVQTGDWLMASLLFIFGRVGFTAANVFYDALLPHIAREEDQDRVSTRGYAMGYLGGGILLAINVVMLNFLPGTWGARLSFLSVAIWWGIFSIPLFRRVPEPPAATAELEATNTFAAIAEAVSISFKRLSDTFTDIRQYKELFKYLVAFLIYNDGIGTIIGVAAIYGAELGFGSVEMVLALLLVQFVGIPFSLIFGRLPSPEEKRRSFYMAFIIFNLIALPIVGILGASNLSDDVTGASPDPFEDTASAVGEGTYSVSDESVEFVGDWSTITVPAEQVGMDEDVAYARTSEADSSLTLSFNGQEVEVTYGIGPEGGIWTPELDGEPLMDEDGEQILVDSFHSTARFGETSTFTSEEPGEHLLRLVNTGRAEPSSQGNAMTIAQLAVLPPSRESDLIMIIGLLIAIEAVGLILSAIFGRFLFSGIAERMTTKSSIILALSVYAVIAIWGFFLDSVMEFWFLAWMVAVVQGGSQALSRSLYSSMSPSAKSGEFFGLFGVMEKFSSILGPLIFAVAVATFGSSRPAILSVIAFFILGGLLLTFVNVDEGRKVAREEDEALLQAM